MDLVMPRTLFIIMYALTLIMFSVILWRSLILRSRSLWKLLILRLLCGLLILSSSNVHIHVVWNMSHRCLNLRVDIFYHSTCLSLLLLSKTLRFLDHCLTINTSNLLGFQLILNAFFQWLLCWQSWMMNYQPSSHSTNLGECSWRYQRISHLSA